jgi:hypothetical protein
MSYEPSHSTEHLPPPELQADEHVASGKVIAIGIAALIVFAGATWWSYRLMDRALRADQPSGPIAPPSEIGKPEIGIVDQIPFETTRSAVRARQQDNAWLESYGWIDRDKGIIHVPIDRAIDAFLAQQKEKRP